MSQRTNILALFVVVLLAVGCAKKEEGAERADKGSKPTSEELARFDELTIAFIMQGPGLIGTSPSRLRFSADGTKLYFSWNSPDKLDSLNAEAPESAYDHYVELQDEAGYQVLDIASGSIDKLTDEKADSLVPTESAWNKARTRRAEIRDGDLFLVDLDEKTTRQITATLARESQVHVSQVGSKVYFRRDDNLYMVPWSGGPIRQLTDIRIDEAPAEDEPSVQQQFLIDQQKQFFKDFEKDEEELKKKHPAAVYIGKGWSIDEIAVSPSGRYAALEISKEPSDAREPLVAHFVTKSGYVETRETRPKVDDLRESVQIRMVDLEGDSIVPVDIDDEYGTSIRSWSPTSDVLLVRSMPDNFKHRFFYTIDPERRNTDGAIPPRTIDDYSDTAWVGGPGFYRTGGWLPDGSAVYFVSEEKDGFSHLFTVTLDGRRTQLTQGNWEIYSARPSFDGSRWFLVTNEEETGSHRLWTMDADGTHRRVLTPEVGQYVPTYSPDEGRIALLRSTLTTPPELYLFDVAKEELSDPVTASTTELFRRYAWVRPEVVSIRASDGEHFRAHIFRPEMFGKRSNKAGVVFIHGAGYLQNVMDWWSYYYREYMFNHLLALNGYTVLNVDFRASAGYGRSSRVAIHRHMGGRDLDDIIDAAKYLTKREGVAEDKVGVYGGSYGGFLTIMALFKYPDVITCGAAIRSVTDWAHYNHWYTSRILGTPENDPDAYEQSSPIYFAENFEGGLLMLHGLVDANVLAQDVLRLSQRLIELGKEDWDLVLYPLEGHAFERASSWTNEYRRIFKLFEEKLSNK